MFKNVSVLDIVMYIFVFALVVGIMKNAAGFSTAVTSVGTLIQGTAKVLTT